METKKPYETPATNVLELKFSGIVCQSPPSDQYTLPGYGDMIGI